MLHKKYSVIFFTAIAACFFYGCNQPTELPLKDSTAVTDVENSNDSENLFDPNPSWPLCGRISEELASVSGWQSGENCPAYRIGDAQYSDFPLSSTFGPRQLVSGGYRYDLHRGIDIPTPIGTPIFAVSDGIVKKAGMYSAFTDTVILIRHFKPGYAGTSCTDSGGCYNSVYLHMNSVVVSENVAVSKGDLIGYSGESESGFAHLHFEIRHAPSDDAYSAWQQDAIHPLNVLPYVNPSENNMTVSVDNVIQSGAKIHVTATVSTPLNELDLKRIEVSVYSHSTGQLIPQPNTVINGYTLKPAWFDAEVWNQQYTHKDSSTVTWDSFAAEGERECPYHLDHGASYDANIHMDQANADYQIGDFNGVLIEPEYYNDDSSSYITHYTFKDVIASTEGEEDSCVIVQIEDLQGTLKSTQYNCATQ